MVQNTKQTVIFAGVWALLVTVVYFAALRPTLDPARFWREAHADEAMMVGFMEKNYGQADFARDFVLNTAPKSAAMYNPLNLAMLHAVLPWHGGDIPPAFFHLTLLAIFAYVLISFPVFRHLARSAGPGPSLAIAALISAASTQYLYFAVGSDIWGLGPLPTSRASQYVLPLVMVVVYCAVRNFGENRLGRTFLIFILCGIAAIMHPVTGLHLFVVLSTASFGYELINRRRVVLPAVARAAGFGVGAMPTILSVLHNQLFGLGHSQPAASPVPKVDAAEVFQAIGVVDPSAAIHRLPDLLTYLPHPHAITYPIAIALLGVFALACVFCFARTGWARWRGNTIAKGSATALFLTMLALSSAVLWMVTCLLRPDQPLIGSWKGPWWYVLAALVAGVPAMYGIIVRRPGPTPFDKALLATMCVTLLWTVVGSWVSNWLLARLHSPVRNAEQIRGLRIAWACWLLWLCIVLAEGWKTRPLRPGAVAVGLAVAAVFAASIHGLWRDERTPDPLAVDWLDVAKWVKAQTPADALLAVATDDLRNDSIRLKAFSLRSMAFSYDAINIVYTNPPGEIEASHRLQKLTAVSEGTVPARVVMQAYGIDYLVIDAGRVEAEERVVYRNGSYAVVGR